MSYNESEDRKCGYCRDRGRLPETERESNFWGTVLFMGLFGAVVLASAVWRVWKWLYS